MITVSIVSREILEYVLPKKHVITSSYLNGVQR